MQDTHGSKAEKHSHHILPDRMAFLIGGSLIVLTWVTYAIAQIDLGTWNLVVAMVIAVFKASLVALIFMGLKYDHKENGLIFVTSFIFLGIFIGLTSTDIFFRGDVYVSGPYKMNGVFVASQTAKASKLKNPWVSTPELVEHGKSLFAVNCVPCHGATGHGDGPAAEALNPHPRNFTSNKGWVNGRMPSEVFRTLRDGVAGSAMASFATLPADDRWALVHYVLSLGPPADKETPDDLKKIGFGPGSSGGAEAPTIPIDVAMDLMTEHEGPKAHGIHAVVVAANATGAARLFGERCAKCHGMRGEGGIEVKNLGVNPRAFVTTRAFSGASDALRSAEAFGHRVANGLPGDLMPGNGELSSTEMSGLYQFVKSLARR